MTEETRYVGAEEIRLWLPANADVAPEILEVVSDEEEARVKRVLLADPLPPGNPEIAGVIRDFALARIFERLFGSQSRAASQRAQVLNQATQDRLTEIYRDMVMAQVMTASADNVSNITDNPLWGPFDVFTGYQWPPPGYPYY